MYWFLVLAFNVCLLDMQIFVARDVATQWSHRGGVKWNPYNQKWGWVWNGRIRKMYSGHGLLDSQVLFTRNLAFYSVYFFCWKWNCIETLVSQLTRWRRLLLPTLVFLLWRRNTFVPTMPSGVYFLVEHSVVLPLCLVGVQKTNKNLTQGQNRRRLVHYLRRITFKASSWKNCSREI